MNNAARQFLFLLSSTRRLGNTEQLAYCAAHPLPASIKQRWLNLQDIPLPNFVDLRHNLPFPLPSGNSQMLLDATVEATDIVLVTPLYMYGLPVMAKQYLDYWTTWLRSPSLNFREQMQGKMLWSIVVSSGGRFEAQPLEASLMLTAQFMQMHWGGMLHGSGSRPNDIQDDAIALEQAKTFFLSVPDPSVLPPLPMMARRQKVPLE
jgi:NAD(P)H-dependent FMN reductase